MADWYLMFRGTKPIDAPTAERLLYAVTGEPVKVQIGDPSGNPRDGYSIAIVATSHYKDITVEMRLLTQEQILNDPAPYHDEAPSFTLRGQTFANKLGLWRALRDVLGAIGCADLSIAQGGSNIIDDAQAAGEHALASRLRDERLQVLADEAPSSAILLMSVPPDHAEIILAGHKSPEKVTSITIVSCNLDALPAGLARFPNIERFGIDQLDATALRSLAAPQLETLALNSSALRRLAREDVAGFPLLSLMNFEHSGLEELDPDIIEVCPKISRVYVWGTKFCHDAAQLAAVRARWPATVHWGTTSWL